MLRIYPFYVPLSRGVFHALLIAFVCRSLRVVLFPSCFEAADLYARSAGDFGYVAPASPAMEG